MFQPKANYLQVHYFRGLLVINLINFLYVSYILEDRHAWIWGNKSIMV